MPLNIEMTQSNPPLSLIEWASRMAELNTEFAELMHDAADQLAPIDADLAARFYQAADLTRLEVGHLREIVPRQAMANLLLLVIGGLFGFGFYWLITFL